MLNVSFSFRATSLCGIHSNCPIRPSAPGITNCSRKHLDSCSLPDEPSPLLMSNQKIQPEILKERESVLKNKDWNKDNGRARSGQKRAHRWKGLLSYKSIINKTAGSAQLYVLHSCSFCYWLYSSQKKHNSEINTCLHLLTNITIVCERTRCNQLLHNNLRKLCHYVHHSWLIILVALILFLSSFKDFSTFCFKWVCCYKILDELCEKRRCA